MFTSLRNLEKSLIALAKGEIKKPAFLPTTQENTKNTDSTKDEKSDDKTQEQEKEGAENPSTKPDSPPKTTPELAESADHASSTPTLKSTSIRTIHQAVVPDTLRCRVNVKKVDSERKKQTAEKKDELEESKKDAVDAKSIAKKIVSGEDIFSVEKNPCEQSSITEEKVEPKGEETVNKEYPPQNESDEEKEKRLIEEEKLLASRRKWNVYKKGREEKFKEVNEEKEQILTEIKEKQREKMQEQVDTILTEIFFAIKLTFSFWFYLILYSFLICFHLALFYGTACYSVPDGQNLIGLPMVMCQPDFRHSLLDFASKMMPSNPMVAPVEENGAGLGSSGKYEAGNYSSNSTRHNMQQAIRQNNINTYSTHNNLHYSQMSRQNELLRERERLRLQRDAIIRKNAKQDIYKSKMNSVRSNLGNKNNTIKINQNARKTKDYYKPPQKVNQQKVQKKAVNVQKMQERIMQQQEHKFPRREPIEDLYLDGLEDATNNRFNGDATSNNRGLIDEDFQDFERFDDFGDFGAGDFRDDFKDLFPEEVY